MGRVYIPVSVLGIVHVLALTDLERTAGEIDLPYCMNLELSVAASLRKQVLQFFSACNFFAGTGRYHRAILIGVVYVTL